MNSVELLGTSFCVMFTSQQKPFFTRTTPDEKADSSQQSPDQECFLDEMSITCDICLKLIHNCLSIVSCCHKFCGSCLLTWMKYNRSCPRCRNNICNLTPDVPFQDIISQYVKRYPLRGRTAEEQEQANQVELACLEKMLGQLVAASEDGRLRQLRQNLARLGIIACCDLSERTLTEENSDSLEISFVLSPGREIPVADLQTTPENVIEVPRPPTPYPTAEQIRQAEGRLPLAIQAAPPPMPEFVEEEPQPPVEILPMPRQMATPPADRRLPAQPRHNVADRRALIVRVLTRIDERPQPTRMHNPIPVQVPAVVDAVEPPPPPVRRRLPVARQPVPVEAPHPPVDAVEPPPPPVRCRLPVARQPVPEQPPAVSRPVQRRPSAPLPPARAAAVARLFAGLPVHPRPSRAQQ